MKINKQNILLVPGIFIFCSYLFQIYWTSVDVIDAVVYVKEGGAQRTFFKLFGSILVYIALIRFFTFTSFTHNLVIKIPLLYYIATVIILIPIFLSEGYQFSGAHLMAANLVIFSPLLFLDFYGEKGDEIFLKITKIIVWVVCLQLLADFIIKWYDYNLVNTILGGMGNANTFGLHLIIASLGLRFLYRQHIMSNILLVFTWGTGSLVCSLVASFLLLQSLIINIIKRPLSFIYVFIVLLMIFLIWGDNLFLFISEFGPVRHAYMKMGGLFSLEAFDVGSVRGRIKWMIDGLQLMQENPISIILGHPGFLPFWTGDGFFFALLVTLGLPVTLLFILSNFYLVYLGMIEKTSLSQFAYYTLSVYLVFFCTNRILDYWPSGFMYLIVFVYLSRKVEFKN
jgi:hypothetical protein